MAHRVDHDVGLNLPALRVFKHDFQMVPVGQAAADADAHLPDAFLDASVLLDRYGVSAEMVAALLKGWLA